MDADVHKINLEAQLAFKDNMLEIIPCTDKLQGHQMQENTRCRRYCMDSVEKD